MTNYLSSHPLSPVILLPLVNNHGSSQNGQRCNQFHVCVIHRRLVFVQVSEVPEFPAQIPNFKLIRRALLRWLSHIEWVEMATDSVVRTRMNSINGYRGLQTNYVSVMVI